MVDNEGFRVIGSSTKSMINETTLKDGTSTQDEYRLHLNYKDYSAESANSNKSLPVCSLPTSFGNKSLKEESKLFFTSVKDKSELWEKHDFHFSMRYTNRWQEYCSENNYGDAEKVWEDALNISEEWESENKGHYIHKGTLFYFWAVTCFFKDDIEKAFMLMNQAYIEDLKTRDKLNRLEPINELPAGLFLFFNDKSDNQFFKYKLDEIKKFIGELINNYSSQRNRNFKYEDFENKFLRNNSIDTEIKFNFNLCIFKYKKLIKKSFFSGENTVTTNIYLDLFFQLGKVLDLLINKYGNGFDDSIKSFIMKYNPNSTIDKLNLKKQHTFQLDFLKNIENIQFSIDGYVFNICLETDILLSFGFRNLGAHTILTNRFIVENFKELFQRIINSIFLAIEIYSS